MEVGDLEGNVERAKIVGLNLDYKPSAKVRGTVLAVNYPNARIGAECLVRVHRTRKGDHHLLGGFLTRKVPQGFQSLDCQSHLLLGLWEEDMEKSGDYPTFKEINKYFQPGRIGTARYVKQDSSNTEGKAYINSRTICTSSDLSFNSFVVGFPLTKTNSGLLLTESPDDLQRASEIAQKFRVVPIILERLDQYASEIPERTRRVLCLQ
ncbi:MAG: hypothetical protein AABY10_04895 [Nanoarchaeota archaeon]